MAFNEHEVQRRSYPQSAGGQHVAGGFEAIKGISFEVGDGQFA